MVWATHHFKEHLKGQRFILFTDHKPLQTCADAPSTKMLSELQQLALEFAYVIQHKKGINMPAGFLSRLAVEFNSQPTIVPINNETIQKFKL